MAKDQGQVRRVLQILGPEDQETLTILHDPPLMEELLRRQETLAQVKAAGLAGGVDQPLPGVELPLRVFPAVIEELAALPPPARERLLRVHLPTLVARPQEGLALTQFFRGLWISVSIIDDIEYRLVYTIDPQDASVTLLMVRTLASLSERLGAS